MIRDGMLFLLFLCLLLTAGCSKIPEVVDVAFSRVSMTEAPQEIRKAVEENREKEKAAVYVFDQEVYIVITRGEKPTGGYGVEVVDIDKYILDEDRFAVKVKVKYIDPEPGQPVTQAITYPFIIVKTDLKDIPLDTQFRFSVNQQEIIEYPVELSDVCS